MIESNITFWEKFPKKLSTFIDLYKADIKGSILKMLNELLGDPKEYIIIKENFIPLLTSSNTVKTFTINICVKIPSWKGVVDEEAEKEDKLFIVNYLNKSAVLHWNIKIDTQGGFLYLNSDVDVEDIKI